METQWSDAREGLKKAVGAGNYRSWIEPLELKAVENGIATFNVATTFIGNYVAQNFADQIKHEFRRHGLSVERLRFDTRPDRAAARMAVAGEAANDGGGEGASAEAGEDVFTPDQRFTFDHFVVGKSNEIAFAAAKRVAEGGQVIFNPLFLHGGVGLGKTHLMHAIAHDYKARHPDKSVLYISAEQFMWRFITALREKKMIELKQLFRSVDVLMVDDVQFLAGKDSTQEEFFHTFNFLVDHGKQIVISADRTPSDIPDIEDRLITRMQCGLVVDLQPTDYELRVGILHSKIEYFHTIYQGVTIAPNVVEFLAHRIVANVRVLEGALTRLFAMGSLIGRNITIEVAKDLLSDIFRASDRKLSIEEIQRKVCEHYNIRLTDMTGSKRLRIYARPRQIAMYLCKKLTNRSFPEIGRRFGGKDHTTVMYAVNKVEELISSDATIAEDIDLLRRALEG